MSDPNTDAAAQAAAAEAAKKAADEEAARKAADEAAAAKKAKRVKARVLVDCAHGKCGDVVLVDPEVLAVDQHKDTGLHELDASKAAVSFAEGVLAARSEAARKAAERDAEQA